MRRAAIAVLALAVLAAAGAIAAEIYPAKPVRLIVPFPPGGGTDIIARLVGQKFSAQVGQPLVIDNRGGANAIIGTDLAAKSPGDGYTLLVVLPASMAVNPALYPNLPYDPLRDFAPVIQFNSIPLLMAAHPSLPAKTVAALIQLARSRPGQVIFASSGTGGSSHLALELFKLMTRTDMVHVPYKGGGPAMNELLGGQVQLYAGTVIGVLPFVKTGKLRALGVTSLRRIENLPEIPAIAETVAGYESVVWQGIVAPRATPEAIVSRLNTEFAQILNRPEVRERFIADGTIVVGGSAAQFAILIKSEIAGYARLVKVAGVKVEQN